MFITYMGAIFLFLAISYSLRLITGPEQQAPLESQVYIKLNGTEGDSGIRWLSKNKSGDPAFSTDQVTICKH